MLSPEEHSEFYTELGNRIREARLKAEISQDNLAEKLDLTRASIVNIEKGRQRPMIHTLVLIAELLKTSIYHLIPGAQNVDVSISANSLNSWADFTDIVSDEFMIDESTQNAVKKFVNRLKK